MNSGWLQRDHSCGIAVGIHDDRVRLCARCAPGPTRARLLESDWAIRSKGSAHVSIAQVEVEPLRIEMATDPAFVIAVLGMARIAQTLEEASIAVRATDIFGWSCTGTVDAPGHLRGRLKDEELLEFHQVTPVIAEVVDADEVDVVAVAESSNWTSCSS
jgi:hypothetical protein